MRPSFRIKDIVDKIFLNSKYNINSEFLESDYFKKLYLLDVSNFKRQISNDDYLFKVGLSAQQNVNHLTKFNPILFDTISGWAGYNGGEVSEFFDNGYFDESNNKYEPDTTVTAKYKMELVMSTNTTPSFDVLWRIGTATSYEAGVLIPANTAPHSPKVYYIETDSLTFNVGDDIQASIIIDSGDNNYSGTIYDSIGTGSIYGSSYTKFFNDISDVEPTYQEGEAIAIADVLNGFKQIDIIKSLKHLFNLYFMTNEDEKTITIEPYNDFYTGASRDISTQLDTNKVLKLRYSKTPARNIFKYKPDTNDITQKFLTVEANLGNYTEIMDNINLRGEKTYINNIFGYTKMQSDAVTNLGLNARVPAMQNQDKDGDSSDLSFVPRILYYDSNATETWKLDNTGLTEYPYFYSFDNSDNENSLNFSDSSYGDGLFSRYYDQQFKILDGVFDDRKVPVQLTCYIKWTESDISNILSTVNNKDFRACVYLDYERIRGHYYIQQIENYNPDRVSHKTVLIRVIDTSTGFNLLKNASLGDFAPSDFSGDFLIN